MADADGVAELAAEVPDDADVELGVVVAVVEVVDVDPVAAPLAATVDVVVETDVVAETDVAAVDWCVAALAIHPVSAAAPATLSRPVAYRARRAGCGRRRRR